MPKLIRPSAFSILIAMSSVALGVGFKHEAGSQVWTEPAGSSGTKSAELVTLADYFGVQTLKLWDFDKRTCQLQIEQGSFNSPSSAVLDAVKICEPRLSQSWKRADLGAGNYVTSLAVCTSKSKDGFQPVRGVELRGASLGDKGNLLPAKAPVKVEFTGCEKWTKRVSCPAGSVATGIRGYSEADQGVVGLALRCHRVEVMK